MRYDNRALATCTKGAQHFSTRQATSGNGVDDVD
jgi:hypothetical protein